MCYEERFGLLCEALGIPSNTTIDHLNDLFLYGDLTCGPVAATFEIQVYLSFTIQDKSRHRSKDYKGLISRLGGEMCCKNPHAG